VWVKVNQLHRLIRTGITGHWLNHTKEHCLVGVKGRPQLHAPGIDCNVIVSQLREISRKPDELYAIIDRLSPGGRKIGALG
jgi:mRNA (2'-O-methyladenosine-N6-)-methyltransferase